MSADAPEPITSAANPQFKELRRLAQDNAAYRKQGRIWLEGDHLCEAALARGVTPLLAVFSESFWPQARIRRAWAAIKSIAIADSLFAGLSALDSPAQMGFVLPLPPAPAVQADAPTVVLDRLQDAGNVGAILRCASAFGFRQVVALKGTAALWSPKVLRAGMGAHFGLALVESLDADDLAQLRVPLVATSSHHGQWLHQAPLPWPCAWVFGHEGQGVAVAVAARAALAVRINQPGGEESLNVASAAAICLHASAAGR